MMDELVQARDKCAQIIALYGDVYLPIFERLDNEIQALESRQSALDKARMIAARSGVPFTSKNVTRNGTQTGTQIRHQPA